jgi:hypothetical protein
VAALVLALVAPVLSIVTSKWAIAHHIESHLIVALYGFLPLLVGSAGLLLLPLRATAKALSMVVYVVVVAVLLATLTPILWIIACWQGNCL